MKEISLKLDVFEGPLDLLLHLIQTLEIDIYDIPIAEVTGQYMAYIHTMQTLELDVAGEYIVMAATLMSIKSKLLLPKQELVLDEEEEELISGEDPRDALVAQLLEYRKFKYAAQVLKEKEEERGQYFTKEPSNLDEYKEVIPPLNPNQVTTIDLFLAFHDILERRKQLEPVETTISSESVTLEDKIAYIRLRLKQVPKNKGVSFNDLFAVYTKSEVVTTFMALLELIKEGEIVAQQANNYEPILLYQKGNTKNDE